MAKKSSGKLRSYYAFRRAVQEKYGVSWKDSAVVWREAQDKLGVPRARDVARHPRIVKRAVATALVAAAKVSRRARPLPLVVSPTRGKAHVPAPGKKRPKRVEYEVTIKYEGKGQTVDVTVRLLAPINASNEDIQRMLIVARLHPELAPDGFREFRLLGGINWRREYGSGRSAAATENEGGAEDLAAFRGILKSGTWRIARVDE